MTAAIDRDCPAVEATDLVKSFPVAAGWRDLLRPQKRRQALCGVSFRAHSGRVLGILGANGAGKTTLIKILCTALLPDGGNARVFGHDVVSQAKAAKRRMAMVVNEDRSFYYRLSCRHNLEFFAALWDLYGKEARTRIDEALRRVGLFERAEDRFDRLSSGMRQRMSIARGLLMDPELLFLDEPTRSLDPVTTVEIHRFIREELVERQRKTVLVATNRLEEAETLAQDLLVLRAGKVVAAGSLGEVAAEGRSRLLELLTPPRESEGAGPSATRPRDEGDEA